MVLDVEKAAFLGQPVARGLDRGVVDLGPDRIRERGEVALR